MSGPTQLLIGGKFQNARSGKTFPSINPATEEVLADVAEADAQTSTPPSKRRGRHLKATSGGSLALANARSCFGNWAI